MRSRHADTFNHDADAPDYDDDVCDEAHPIRTGYAELLAWVARSAQIDSRHDVLELGAGTGNLTRLLLPARRIVAVDVSRAMLNVAANKTAKADSSNCIEWTRDDLLAYFDSDPAQFDRIVSTYAIHHLQGDEKRVLFQRIRAVAKPGARVVLGDLMFESAQHRIDALARYQQTWPDVAEAIEQEFFWMLDESVQALKDLGFEVARRRFSDLSWGVGATLS